MKTVIRATAKQKRLLSVSELVVVMAQFVMHGNEIVGSDVDTQLQANILVIINVPGAGMTNHVTITRFRQHRPLPKRLRQRGKPERLEKSFTILHNSASIDLLGLQNLP